MAANPDANLLDVETVFRDGGARTYLIACPGKMFPVITGGMTAWIAALAANGLSPDANRAALAETHPMPK